MKKVVNIHFEDETGNTSLTTLNLRVDGVSTTVTNYTIKQGWKLKLFELDAYSRQDAEFHIEVSYDGTNYYPVKSIMLPADVHVGRSWRFPLIIEAHKSDAYLRLRYKQDTAGIIRGGLSGVVEEFTNG